jgi:mRNA interferase YafQ
MRAIERTSRFKRDYRREKSGVLSKKLDHLLIEAIELLAADKPLPQRISTTRYRASGAAFATVISDQI